jgi:hypothetical protein
MFKLHLSIKITLIIRHENPTNVLIDKKLYIISKYFYWVL